MKCSIVLLVLVLSIMTAFLVHESNAVIIAIKPKIRTYKLLKKKTRSSKSNIRKANTGRSVTIFKNKIKKKGSSRQRVPGMHGKHLF